MEEVHITESEGMMTARLAGRLDTPAAVEVTHEIQPLLDHADRTLVLDCSELTYISSSGLRIFLSIRKAAATAGGSRCHPGREGPSRRRSRHLSCKEHHGPRKLCPGRGQEHSVND